MLEIIKVRLNVHLSDWADQPDLRIKCTQEWTQPERAQPVDLEPELFGNRTRIYAAENGALYTFDKDKVTCARCRGARIST